MWGTSVGVGVVDAAVVGCGDSDAGNVAYGVVMVVVNCDGVVVVGGDSHVDVSRCVCDESSRGVGCDVSSSCCCWFWC